MNKKVSKREERKLEKIKLENIQKFDAEYKQNRIISDEYKKKIKHKIFINALIAITIIIYLITINILSLYLETKTYIYILKALSVLISVISVIFFEISYRKDNGFLFLNGIEFLIIATVTLFSVYAYTIFYAKYNVLLFSITGVISIYYLIKIITIMINMKRKYYKEQSDIKDIIKKEKRKND